MDNIGQKQSKSNRLGMFIIVFLLLLSLIGNGIMGYSVVFNKPKVGTICGDSVIAEYNKAYEDLNNYRNELEKVASSIKSKKDYSSDVNCLTMTYLGTNRPKDLYVKIGDLIKKGENPSLNIMGIGSYKSIAPVNSSDSIEGNVKNIKQRI
ncbi:MAG: hypothetical protein Q4A23_03090 [bacterium]|nr:hypothetical protein [bacterium]